MILEELSQRVRGPRKAPKPMDGTFLLTVSFNSGSDPVEMPITQKVDPSGVVIDGVTGQDRVDRALSEFVDLGLPIGAMLHSRTGDCIVHVLPNAEIETRSGYETRFRQPIGATLVPVKHTRGLNNLAMVRRGWPGLSPRLELSGRFPGKEGLPFSAVVKFVPTPRR